MVKGKYCRFFDVNGLRAIIATKWMLLEKYCTMSFWFDNTNNKRLFLPFLALRVNL